MFSPKASETRPPAIRRTTGYNVRLRNAAITGLRALADRSQCSMQDLLRQMVDHCLREANGPVSDESVVAHPWEKVAVSCGNCGFKGVVPECVVRWPGTAPSDMTALQCPDCCSSEITVDPSLTETQL